VNDLEELRTLIREMIRDLLPEGLPIAETVNLSTDADLAAFVGRLLDLSPEEREDIRSGRKRFRLAAAAPVHPTPEQPGPAGNGSIRPPGPAANGSVRPADNVRRIERGAVTEAVVAEAARAGERLVLGRGAVLTPLARDRARASGVEIDKER
jgi:hypothetical protein